MWQDYIFFLGTLLMALSLVPTMVAEEKPAVSTSVLIAVILSVFAFNFLTMNMPYTFVITGIEAIMWYVLLFQKVRKDGKAL